MKFSSGEMRNFDLNLKSSFTYEKIVGDEVNDLKIAFRENQNLDTLVPFVPIKLYNETKFKVSAIKIFGQKRIRKWDEDMAEVYFGEEESNSYDDVSDFLFTNEFLVFENGKKEQLVFYVNREMIGFERTQNFESKFLEDYYYKSELELDKNIESQTNLFSSELRIKLHYLIS